MRRGHSMGVESAVATIGDLYDDLKGKRLLFLGATAAIKDLVLLAKSVGIYTIVTDYIPNAAAKEVADKSYDISTFDLDKLSQIIESDHVNGVITGFSDANLMPCYALAKKWGFPFYATENQIEITTNKIKFKDACRRCGLPVVPEYHLDDDLDDEDISKMSFPVIMKPADSYASKGIAVCETPAHLKEKFDFSKSYSPTGKVIVERYIQGWTDSCCYFTIQNGVPTLSAMTDRDMRYTHDGHAQQPNVMYYPSRFIDDYYARLHQGICKYVDLLGIKNGTMFVQLFAKDGEFLIFESGYRLCGASEYIIVSEENEINTGLMHIRYALTGQFDGWKNTDFDNARFKNRYCILVVSVRPGKISQVIGMDRLLQSDCFINALQYYRVGDTVSDASFGTFSQAFARIYLRARNDSELDEAIRYVRETVDVLDSDGNSLVID